MFIDNAYLTYIVVPFREQISFVMEKFDMWKNFDYIIVLVQIILLCSLHYVIHASLGVWIGLILNIAWTYWAVSNSPRGSCVIMIMSTMTLTFLRIKSLFRRKDEAPITSPDYKYKEPSMIKSLVMGSNDILYLITFVAVALLCAAFTENPVMRVLPAITALIVIMLSSNKVGGNSNWMLMTVVLVFIGSMLFVPAIYEFVEKVLKLPFREAASNSYSETRPPIQLTPTSLPYMPAPAQIVGAVLRELFRAPGLATPGFFLVIHILGSMASSYLVFEQLYSTSDTTRGITKTNKPQATYGGIVRFNQPWLLAMTLDWLVTFYLSGFERLMMGVIGSALGFAIYQLRGKSYWESVGVAAAAHSWAGKGLLFKRDRHIGDRIVWIVVSTASTALLYGHYVHATLGITIVALGVMTIMFKRDWFLAYAGLVQCNLSMVLMNLFDSDSLFRVENEAVGEDTPMKKPDDTQAISIGGHSGFFENGIDDLIQRIRVANLSDNREDMPMDDFPYVYEPPTVSQSELVKILNSSTKFKKSDPNTVIDDDFLKVLC